MVGPDVQHRGGQSIFLHTLMDIYIYFCRGHGSPKGQRGSTPAPLVPNDIQHLSLPSGSGVPMDVTNGFNFGLEFDITVGHGFN